MKRWGWLAAVISMGCAGCWVFNPPSAADRTAALGMLDQESVITRWLLTADGDFAPMPVPGPGDWLASHPEPGQTFDAFARSAAIHPNPARSVIYLLPLGDFPADTSPLIEDLRAYAEAYFQLDVKVLPAFTPDLDQFHPRINEFTRRRQILTHSVMEYLRTQMPADAFCLLGVTMEDLYPARSWNFVFGQSWPAARVAVYSFARYDPAFSGGERPADYRVIIFRRSCGVLAHELAHNFGLGHCIYYHCLLNGSNNLAEADAAPHHLCPVCLRKLQHAIQFDFMDRYRELSRFYHRHGWADEAAWTDRQLAKAGSPESHPPPAPAR
jgi:archaemetzincin